MYWLCVRFVFFFKQKTAYEMRISDWSSDVCSSDLLEPEALNDELVAGDEMPALPRLVRIGKPEDLLRRRPDVASAERQLAAATAGIGIATADYFPRVTFSGEVGYAASNLRSEEHTSELQSLMRHSYAVFCLKKNKQSDII